MSKQVPNKTGHSTRLPSKQSQELKPSASMHCRSHPAKAETQIKLGHPQELVVDWQQKAVTKIGEVVEKNRSLQVFLDACVGCGACTDKCHYYQGTGDPNNMPVARQNLFRDVYNRYYTFSGKYLPKLVGARDMDETVLNDWYTYFHQCSQCRRCAVYCPFGIDTAEFAIAAREVMNAVGVGQKYTNEVVEKALNKGNNLGLSPRALKNTLEELEDDLQQETNRPIKLPLDVPGKDILLVTPSADFFAEPHVEGLLGYAKVLHQAGLSWTLSSQASEAANFAQFSGDHQHMQTLLLRIKSAAQELGVSRIVFGECGHAWRVAQNYFQGMVGSLEFLDPKYPVPQHICELTYDLIKQNKLRFNKNAHNDKIVTFHDSCNIARASSMGDMPDGQFIIPREIIKACCRNFVDMAEDTIKQQTYCCGAGGGMLTDELMELRGKGVIPRAQALKAVVEEYKVTHMVAICAICKSQFTQTLPQYGFAMDRILSLHQLVGDALILE